MNKLVMVHGFTEVRPPLRICSGSLYFFCSTTHPKWPTDRLTSILDKTFAGTYTVANMTVVNLTWN